MDYFKSDATILTHYISYFRVPSLIIKILNFPIVLWDLSNNFASETQSEDLKDKSSRPHFGFLHVKKNFKGPSQLRRT